MRELALHIGTHKTGTTSFQHDLVRWRNDLADSGVLVPLAGQSLGNSDAVSRELAGLPLANPDDVGALEAFSTEIRASDHETIVASGEHFGLSLRQPGRLDRMVELASSMGVHLVLIAVVRDSSTYANSWYQQRVRTLVEPRPFRPWLDRARSWPRFDYAKFFGPAIAHRHVDFRAVPFSRAVAAGVSHSILDEVGVTAPPTPDDAPWLNRSVGPRTVASYRDTAAMLQRIPRPVEPRVRRGLSRRIERLSQARGWNDVRFWGFDAPLFAETAEFFGPKQERFAQRVWGTPWPEPEPTARPRNELGHLWSRRPS